MRVTLDLDKMRIERVRGKAVLLKRTFPYAEVRYRTSSSGNGGHVEMYERYGLVDLETSYNIRRLLGDHDARIRIDLMRGKNDNPMLPLQVLFDYKVIDGIKKEAGKWCYVYE